MQSILSVTESKLVEIDGNKFAVKKYPSSRSRILFYVIQAWNKRDDPTCVRMTPSERVRANSCQQRLRTESEDSGAKRRKVFSFEFTEYFLQHTLVSLFLCRGTLSSTVFPTLSLPVEQGPTVQQSFFTGS